MTSGVNGVGLFISLEKVPSRIVGLRSTRERTPSGRVLARCMFGVLSPWRTERVRGESGVPRGHDRDASSGLGPGYFQLDRHSGFNVDPG